MILRFAQNRPGLSMQTHHNLKVLEVRYPIQSDETNDIGRGFVEKAISQINIKCQYESPAVDFEEEVYLQAPEAYADQVGKSRSKDRRR